MRVVIQQIGESSGIVLPTALLTQLGLESEAEISIENGAFIIRPPRRSPRDGWAEASKTLAESGDDALVMPDFPNASDAKLEW